MAVDTGEALAIAKALAHGNRINAEGKKALDALADRWVGALAILGVPPTSEDAPHDVTLRTQGGRMRFSRPGASSRLPHHVHPILGYINYSALRLTRDGVDHTLYVGTSQPPKLVGLREGRHVSPTMSVEDMLRLCLKGKINVFAR